MCSSLQGCFIPSAFLSMHRVHWLWPCIQGKDLVLFVRKKKSSSLHRWIYCVSERDDAKQGVSFSSNSRKSLFSEMASVPVCWRISWWPPIPVLSRV